MTPHLPQAIIFDLDDTIIAEAEMSERCWEEVCTVYSVRLGGTVGEILLETIREIRRGNLANRERLERGGSDLRSIRQNLLLSAFAALGIEDTSLVQEMTNSYMALKSVLVEPVPGALDTLRKLKQEGIRLAMITNGPAEEHRAKMQRAELEHFFEYILVEGEFGVGKPDPQVFNHTLSRLQVTPAQAWMVGDNLVNDVAGAQAVGIYGIWVDLRGTGLPENSSVTPDRIIRSIVELLE